MLQIDPVGSSLRACDKCGEGARGIEFAFAFQPIVDVRTRGVVAYEALARGPNGESAWSVLSQVTPANRFRFDQECRMRAIRGAAALGIEECLSINFIPNAVENPGACIQRTLRTAEECGFPVSRVIFEVTEGEKLRDPGRLVKIFQEYRKLGIRTAIDDFGAGYAGLGLLAQFQPDIVKIDMDIVRGVDGSPARQAIVESIVALCARLGIAVLAEGVETQAERGYLESAGIALMQGFLFAKPAFKALSPVAPEAFGPGSARALA
jgi:EAL domain-containing protein (putative c-di-GMP-specific phosphodiesterase class I)